MNELILENMPLVVSVVKTFNPRNYTEQEDLIDAGRIGLWKALRKYDYSKGKISSYAWKSIRWFVKKEIDQFKKHAYKQLKDEHVYCHSKFNLWEFLPKELTSLETEILRLKLDGCSVKEISEILDISTSVAKNSLYKAIKKIKKGINDS
jgi:RNA polymerase sigma factor (sigma-70 family)